jgi:hypothetical protein
MRGDAAAFCRRRVLGEGGSSTCAPFARDKPRLLDHFGRLSARSVYFRFFPGEDAPDRRRAAPVHRARLPRSRGIGGDPARRAATSRSSAVGRYALLDTVPGQPKRAEVRRFAVGRCASTARHRRGCCSSIWRRSPAPTTIEEFEADVLRREQRSMLAVFLRSGYR